MHFRLYVHNRLKQALVPDVLYLRERGESQREQAKQFTTRYVPYLSSYDVSNAVGRAVSYYDIRVVWNHLCPKRVGFVRVDLYDTLKV